MGVAGSLRAAMKESAAVLLSTNDSLALDRDDRVLDHDDRVLDRDDRVLGGVDLVLGRDDEEGSSRDDLRHGLIEPVHERDRSWGAGSWSW